MFLGPRGPLVLPLVNPFVCLPARSATQLYPRSDTLSFNKCAHLIYVSWLLHQMSDCLQNSCKMLASVKYSCAKLPLMNGSNYKIISARQKEIATDILTLSHNGREMNMAPHSYLSRIGRWRRWTTSCEFHPFLLSSSSTQEIWNPGMILGRNCWHLPFKFS